MKITKKLSSIYFPLPFAIATIALSGCGGTSTDDASGVNDAGTLVINEIVAKDADGGNDWIELYVTEGTVNLSDYSLVDDDTEHEKQSLPDITLSAGEYVIIEAVDEEDVTDDGYYVTFKLGGDDALSLYYLEGLSDQLDWLDGDAEEGFSYGLLPNGTGDPATLIPTKGTENIASTEDGSEGNSEDSSEGNSEDDVISDTVIDSTSPLVINEVVAKDSNDGADWIEFYNRGDSSVSLADYSVIDDDALAVVSLPAVILVPGAYYTVYASTDEIEGVDTVAFKLGSSDSVSLVQGDDLIDKVSWDKGDALIGVSYGRFPDGSTNTQSLLPSLNGSNQIAQRGPLVINEVVTKDESGGSDWFELYNNGTSAIDLSQYNINDESDDAEPSVLPEIMLAVGEHIVIYATDEELADGANGVPFKLGSSESLTLVLNDETVDYIEWDDSDAPEGYSYGSITDGSWDKNTLDLTPGSENIEVSPFSTNSVESLYIEIAESDWDDMLENALDEENHSVAVTYKGVTLDSVAMRTKGNSSLSSVYNMGSDRFSFKLDMNEYVSGQKLLGLKKLNLNNNYKDPTYMRETISYNLMRDMGLPAPRTSYANIFINGELHGFYSLVEQVDSEFLERNFSNENGDLYKPDSTDVTNPVGNDLVWVDDEFTSYNAIELKTNEDSADNQAIVTMMDVINNGGDLASVVDVDAVLRYLAVSTALSNLDSYQGGLAHNYYIYEQDGVFSVVPWDLNESFGTFNMGCSDEEIVGLLIDEPTSGILSERPLIAALLESDSYKQTYHDYLQTLVDGSLSLSSIEDEVDTISNLIREYVALDPTAFTSVDDFDLALTTDSNGVYGLTSFVEARNESIQDQLDGVIASSGDGSGSCASGGGFPGGPGGF